MPRRKRNAHAKSMNSKRWCKGNDQVDVNKTEKSADSNIRLQNLNSVENCESSDAESYVIVNIKQIKELFTAVKCPTCEKQALKLELGTKLGFAYNLNLTCNFCVAKVSDINTSCDKKKNGVHDVNLRMTQAFSHIGKGYSSIEKFCMIMNMLPYSSRTHAKCVKELDSAYSIVAQNVLKDIHNEVKNAYGTSDTSSFVDISVTFDGTWLTRGHTSLIGVGCVIDILTGYVVDFEVMSKVCRDCSIAKNELGENSVEYNIWYSGHKSVCDINHSGSSGSMEMRAASILWKRSLSLGFRYTTLLSDGDCKTYNHLCDEKIYGNDVDIAKEECINHVSKRLGTSLRNIVKDCRVRGITLGGKGHGSLKESTIKKLTIYYQKAILRHKGDANAMKKAIYATLYHSISTDKKPQHTKCPTGPDSWCFYQAAVAKGENTGSHKLKVGTPINEAFLPHILPIYQRLASSELLERCVRCGTQNANESLHSMIWAKCPKEVFSYKKRVKRCATEAICEFNKGTVWTVRETQSVLGVSIGNNTNQVGVTLDSRKKLFRA